MVNQNTATIFHCIISNISWTLQGEWVIKFNGLSRDSRQWGPYRPYKLCNHSPYIGIIIFPHIDNDNPQSQATIYFKTKDIKKEIQESEGTYSVDLSLEMAALHQFTIVLNT